jgi:hypothetical protein
MAAGRDRQDYPELPTNLVDHPDRLALAELNEIIVKACQADPRQRYQSEAELNADSESGLAYGILGMALVGGLQAEELPDIIWMAGAYSSSPGKNRILQRWQSSVGYT